MVASSRSGLRPVRVPVWMSFAIGPVLIALLVAALAAMAIRNDQQRFRDSAEISTQNMVRLLDANVADMFDKADVFLQLIAHEYLGRFPTGEADAAKVATFLAGREIPGVQLQSLQIADTQGEIRYGKGLRPELLPNLDAPSYFDRLRRDPSAGLVLGGPVFSRAARQWVLVLARGLWTADGQFAGAVLAHLAVNQVGKSFAELELGRLGAASLRTADLALVYREPSSAESQDATGSADVSAQLREAVRRSPLAGQYMASTAVDRVERINAYRKVRGYPFYVLVGLSTEEMFAGWRANMRVFVALAASTILINLFAGFSLYRASRRQYATLHNRFEAIVQTSSDAIIGKTVNGLVTSWNRGAQDMFGYSAEEMIGQPMQRLLPPDRPAEEADILTRIQNGEAVEPFETVRLRKDGTRIDVSVAISPIFDDAGLIVGASNIARNITRQKALEEEIRAMAFNDVLTRLPNRRLLVDRLQRAQLNSVRHRTWFSVLFLDLDDFKQVNDAHGHDAGDQLLIEVSARLQTAVRQNDTVARLGGDEFVVVLEDLGQSEEFAGTYAETVADKILGLVEQDYMLGTVRHRCSASIGIKLLMGSDQTPEQILKDADAAMYLVKHERRAVLLRLTAQAQGIDHRD